MIFKDYDFAANNQSLGLKVVNRLPVLKWKRLKDVTTAKGLGLGVDQLKGDYDPDDVTQGALGNLWFVSCIRTFSRYPKVIENLFQYSTPEVFEVGGRYVVQLFDSELDGWLQVTLDDQVPIWNGEPAFARSKAGAFWVCLLEKAFGKYVGEYGKLSGGWPAMACTAITGSKSKTYLLSADTVRELQPGSVSLRQAAQIPMESKETPKGDPIKADEFWTQLKEFHRQDLLITATALGFDKYIEKDNEMGGLVLAVLDVKEVKSFKFIKIDNPWGMFEWKGPWGPDSAKWSENKDILEKLKPDQTPTAKELWIEYSSVCSTFHSLTVCYALKSQMRIHQALPSRLPAWTFDPTVTPPTPSTLSLIGSFTRSVFRSMRGLPVDDDPVQQARQTKTVKTLVLDSLTFPRESYVSHTGIELTIPAELIPASPKPTSPRGRQRSPSQRSPSQRSSRSPLRSPTPSSRFVRSPIGSRNTTPTVSRSPSPPSQRLQQMFAEIEAEQAKASAQGHPITSTPLRGRNPARDPSANDEKPTNARFSDLDDPSASRDSFRGLRSEDASPAPDQRVKPVKPRRDSGYPKGYPVEMTPRKGLLGLEDDISVLSLNEADEDQSDVVSILSIADTRASAAQKADAEDDKFSVLSLDESIVAASEKSGRAGKTGTSSGAGKMTLHALEESVVGGSAAAETQSAEQKAKGKAKAANGKKKSDEAAVMDLSCRKYLTAIVAQLEADTAQIEAIHTHQSEVTAAQTAYDDSNLKHLEAQMNIDMIKGMQIILDLNKRALFSPKKGPGCFSPTNMDVDMFDERARYQEEMTAAEAGCEKASTDMATAQKALSRQQKRLHDLKKTWLESQKDMLDLLHKKDIGTLLALYPDEFAVMNQTEYFAQ